MSPRFIKTYKILCIEILFLVALGAAVRSMDAGLACPDWPLCFGDYIPDYHPQVYFEFIHRLLAGIVGIVSITLNVLLLRRPQIPRAIKTVALFAIILLLAQVLMGGLTVLLKLHDKVVATHLALGTGFFAVSLWIYLKVKYFRVAVVGGDASVGAVDKSGDAVDFQAASSGAVTSRVAADDAVASRVATDTGVTAAIEHTSVTNIGGLFSVAAIRYISIGLLVATYGQLLLGGLVASNYAALVCGNEFPFCFGQFIPTLESLIGIHISHRLGAYGLTLAALTYFIFIFRNVGCERLRRWSKIYVGLLAIQIAVGIANVKFLTPPLITVLHLAVGTMLLGSALMLVHWSGYQRR